MVKPPHDWPGPNEEKFKKRPKQRTINDIVKINKDSYFYGQNNNWGRITKNLGDYIYVVRFANGTTNNFPGEHLDALKEGDDIIINEKAIGRYYFTCPGSKGIITEFLPKGNVNVSFYELTGEHTKTPVLFCIEAGYIDTINQEKAAPKEEERKRIEEENKLYFDLCNCWRQNK